MSVARNGISTLRGSGRSSKACYRWNTKRNNSFCVNSKPENVSCGRVNQGRRKSVLSVHLRREGSNAQENPWNNFAYMRFSHSQYCGARGILGGLAKDFRHLASRGAVSLGVELYVCRHRCPHMAPLSLHRFGLPCGDRIAALPGEVPIPRGADFSPCVRGHHFGRSPRYRYLRRVHKAAPNKPLQPTSGG